MKQKKSEKQVQVGVGVIIVKDGKVLAGKRKNAHGDGTWSVPGGKLDYGETAAHCAKREVREETGIKVKHIRHIATTEDYFADEGKHFITLWMVSEYASGALRVTEPDKFIDVGWFSWNRIPTPHFLPLVNLRKRGFVLPLRSA